MALKGKFLLRGRVLLEGGGYARLRVFGPDNGMIGVEVRVFESREVSKTAETPLETFNLTPFPYFPGTDQFQSAHFVALRDPRMAEMLPALDNGQVLPPIPNRLANWFTEEDERIEAERLAEEARLAELAEREAAQLEVNTVAQAGADAAAADVLRDKR